MLQWRYDHRLRNERGLKIKNNKQSRERGLENL